MKFSQILFRLTIFVLVCTYFASISEFFNLHAINVDMDVRPDAIVVTLFVAAFVFLLFRRSR